MEWKEVRLGDVVEIVNGFAFKSKAFTLEGIPVIKIKNIKAGKVVLNDLDYISTSDINPKYTKIRSSDILITMTGNRMDGSPETWVGKVSLFRHQGDFYLNQRVSALRLIDDTVDNNFLSYYLSSWQSQLYFALNSNSSGGQANITPAVVQEYRLMVPELETQRSIASILSSLDRKIELNNKINADLEEMAQAIFKNWFVDFEPFKDGKFVDSELGMIPEGWKVGGLTEIASYMNGLAMQKFPPENNEDSLPVLKIKELGQGFCGPDSDRCSCNIKDECKIHNGDVIFSWSGTLLVDVWCGGDCGLNQHLFKVTSKDYPKWFYYYWTKHHLQEFIHIAKDKAVTMGHIKRGHLEEAMVAIPDNDSMEKAHEQFEPILSKMISLRLENSRLSLLRDTLLPRLMSGELEVPE